MKIYHYTSIETLALILKTKRIRFSRLDTVDDPEEFQYTDQDMQPAQYTFVSCWTRYDKENIPQWKLYGNNQHGVRIGMEEQMFPLFEKNDNPLFGEKGYRYLPDFKEMEHNGYVVMSILDEGYPLYDMIYLDDLRDVRQRIYTQRNNEKAVDTKELGRYKSKLWEFQKECRFIFTALPRKAVMPKELKIDVSKPMKLHHVDVVLSKKAYESMDILLGPCVSEGERIIVEALMSRYLGRADYRESIFAGSINE
jgi:hypothetical protein